MVSTGDLDAASESVRNCLSNYSSNLSELTGSWTGSSYDSIVKNQAQSFLGEYQPIVSQINSFKTAVENYKSYQEVKKKKEQLEQDQANASEENKASFNKAISDAQSNLDTLREAIESNLSAASSPQLTASANTGSGSLGLGGGSGNIDFQKTRYNGTTVWYSVIPKDKKPQLAIANDNYDYLTTEPTSDIAKRKNAKLAINFGLTGEPAGMIYTDGTLVTDANNHCDETLYMTQDGRLDSVRNDEYSTQDIIDMNPVWASKGFYTIARDGEYVDENTIDPNLSVDKHPRTFIGQDYDGNYIVGVCDGRGEDEAGLTLREVYDFVNTEVTDDLRFLFNGDGGGSSAFVYEGEKLNSDTDGSERPRPDAIYWN